MPQTPLRLLVACAGTLMGAGPSLATPRIVVDVAPLHAIVARVMVGVGAPELLLPLGASPHGYALRPSEAGALETAELIFWIGPALTPWLEAPLDTLASDAVIVAVTEAPGVTLLPVRTEGPFEGHDDGAGADHAEGHEAEHAEGHGNHSAGHADRDATHEHGEGGAIDAHVWLDPANAIAFATRISRALSAADEPNAAAYAANSVAFAQEMAALQDEISARLDPVRDRSFFVFHDAYQYFESAFGFPAAGSVALQEGVPPSATRIAALRARIAAEQVVCIFSEPQFEPAIIATVMEGSDLREGVLDPIGAGLEPGPELYPTLMRTLADSLAGCLAG